MLNGLRKLCFGGMTLAALAAGTVGCSGERATRDRVEERRGAITNGMPVTVAENPATVAVYHNHPRPCSGTLLRPNWVVTARHCLTVDTSDRGTLMNPGDVWIGPPDAVNPTNGPDPDHAINPGFYPPPTAIRAYRFVEYANPVDIALVELAWPMVVPRAPSCDPDWDPYCVQPLAPPRAMGLWNGETHELVGMMLRLMGYGKLFPGGQEYDGSSGAGRLRWGNSVPERVFGIQLKFPSAFGGSAATDSGDSGGPTYSMTDRLGRNLFAHAAWHIGHTADGSTAYVRSWLKRTTSFSGTFAGTYRPDIALVGGPWNTFHWASSGGNGTFVRNTASGYVYCDPFTYECTTADLSFFAWAAQQPNVKPVGGDFNGDNRLEIALVGGPWTGLPAVVGMPDGTFLPTFVDSGSFETTAYNSAATPVSGDFNGDGKSDIALVHGNGLNSIPVAWSWEGGGLLPTDTYLADFPGWSRTDGAKAVTGDFDGDGRDDIALVGGYGWGSIPIAHSNGDGSFHLTNEYVDGFPGWGYQATSAVAGDFNGDGRDDIAIVGGDWISLPVAFSAGSGHFWITNVRVADFPGFAHQGAKAVAADIDGDGREDIALTGGPGWNTLPVAFSIGDGSFRVTNSSAGTFPSLAQASNATPFAVHGGGPRRAAHPARDMVAGRHSDGRLEVFYVGMDNQLYRNQQIAPGATAWSGEIPLGGTAKKIALGQHPSGRLELFFIGLNNAIYRYWEVMPWEPLVNGGWSGGVWMAGNAKDLAVTRNQDDRLEIIYIGLDDFFRQIEQSSPNGSWLGDQPFAGGGAGKRLAIEHNLNGGIELFVIGTDDGIWRNSQSVPNGTFGGWSPFGGKARELTVGRHQDGRFQYFYIAEDGSGFTTTTVRTNTQILNGGGAWNGDSPLPGTMAPAVRALDIDVARTTDNRLALMMVQVNGFFTEYVQAVQNGLVPVPAASYSTTGVANPLSAFVVPASAYGPSEVLFVGRDGVVHAEAPGSTPGNHTGDRMVGDPLGDQATLVCGAADEWGPPLTLSCPPGLRFVGTQWVNYGTPTGSCATGFALNYNCTDSDTAQPAVTAACIGKQTCTINVINDVLAPNGTDPCVGVGKRLVAKLYCQ